MTFKNKYSIHVLIFLGIISIVTISPVHAAPPSGTPGDQFGTLHELVNNLEERIETLEAENAELIANVTALKTLLASVTVDSDNIYFTGVNLHVRDGTGNTPCNIPCNGKGNLIVGYNEDRNFGSEKTGSHNFIVGPEHNYLSYGGFVSGSGNTISGTYASVSGGIDNVASGHFSSVSAGRFNQATGLQSSVSGGHSNEASGIQSSVSGGSSNEALADWSSVSGGDRNKAKATSSSVSGGQQNTASHFGSSVSGGYNNTASGEKSSVSGGANNISSGIISSLSGGLSRIAMGPYDWVAGILFQDQ